MLYSLIIEPIELAFEACFSLIYIITHDIGISIIFLSIVVNILILPLYLKADSIQEEESQKQLLMERWTNHIRKNFKKDERYMILNTYYREMKYHPIYALRGTVSLLLQIPFFIAAYHFLSNLSLTEDVAFGPIKNLSRQDQLLHIGNLHVNIMPIIMTLVNILSTNIYSEGKEEKIRKQSYILAIIFLFFLYSSPSGMVVYWTMNNVFSLIKNIVMKRKKENVKRRDQTGKGYCDTDKMFFCSMAFLGILLGLLIPSEVIKSSVEEFIIDINTSPIFYIIHCGIIAIGIFIIWGGIFFFLTNKKTQIVISRVSFCFCGLAIVNYMCFDTRSGRMTDLVTYENELFYSAQEQYFNLAVMLVLFLVLYFFSRKNFFNTILTAGTIAIFGMAMTNIYSINQQYKEHITYARNMEEDPRIVFSKEGKNVMVFMIDSAVGALVPYIFSEKPELKGQFDGFVFYPNTVSFGGVTHYGAPPLFGGYEYTPIRMNERAEEPLAKKHDEAVKLMPSLFYKNGYHITVVDIPYAGYKEWSDLSIYDEYESEEYHLYGNMNGYYDQLIVEKKESVFNRNFFFYSVLRIAPLCARRVIYNGGLYNEPNALKTDSSTNFGGQITESLEVARNYTPAFLDAYNVLDNIGSLTEIDDKLGDNFIMIQNQTPHEHCLLQKPDYKVSAEVNNTAYKDDSEKDYIINGVKMHMDTKEQIEFYHSNMATYLMLARWFDYLREEGVYDNTRIILVADHGNPQYRFDQMVIEGIDLEFYNPVLMVKDFDSHGFSISEEFMTNADVPTLTMAGLIENPVNPYTGNVISNDEKLNGRQYIITDTTNFSEIVEKNTFPQSTYWGVVEDMRNPDNWSFMGIR